MRIEPPARPGCTLSPTANVRDSTSLNNGVLNLVVPKSEAAKPRRIAVKTG